MHRIMIVGSGKIGSAVACFLADSHEYEIHLLDTSFEGSDVKRLLGALPVIQTVSMNIADSSSIESYIQQHQIKAIVSCLPYDLNHYLAVSAKATGAYYFDLTEDVDTTALVKKLAVDAKNAFIPQCGLAPGFTNIVANHLMNQFDSCHQVKLRVGALPQCAHNHLLYALTWSTEGLINEYGNLCEGIVAGKSSKLMPLEGLENLELEGCLYESFNTSGGLGSLVELYLGKVQYLSYQTIRYPGHCDKMRFLMNDLMLNQDRKMLKHILERAVPKTYQDRVLIYVTVSGMKQGEFIEKSYYKTIWPQKVAGLDWSAIQVSSAAGVCAVMDLVLNAAVPYHGLVYQEQLPLRAFLDSKFGKYYGGNEESIFTS